MRTRSGLLPALLFFGLTLLGASVSWAAEELVELYRSPFGRTDSLAASPLDGSCWASTGRSITRVGADGTVLGQISGRRLGPVAVNTADGSYWALDLGDSRRGSAGRVVHFSATGTLLWSSDDLSKPYVTTPYKLAVNPTDGSCWVTDAGVWDAERNAFVGSCLVHFSATGRELWRGDFAYPYAVAVSAYDSAVWVVDDHALIHLSATGERLASVPGIAANPQVAADPRDGSCWFGDQSNQVVHVGADGTVLWRHGLDGPLSALAAGPGDGSCWVSTGPPQAGSAPPVLVHLSADGTELLRQESETPVSALAVQASDGSCWVGTWKGLALAHLSSKGDLLWSTGDLKELISVAVDSQDGSVWVGQEDPWASAGAPGQVLHLTAAGASLWSGGEVVRPAGLSWSPGDRSVWVADAYTNRVLRLGADGTEVVRADNMEGPVSLSIDRSDDSVWVARAAGEDVAHLSAGGAVLWSGGRFEANARVADPISQQAIAASGDGSCWTIDARRREVIHLSASGLEVGVSGQLLCCPFAVAADPRDGSCWVTHRTYAGTAVTHLSASAQQLASYALANTCCPSALALNPRDGSLWVSGREFIIHLSASGEELSWHPAACCLAALSLNPSDGSVWMVSGFGGTLLHTAPHIYVIANPPVPATVKSGGTASLSGSALDNLGHTVTVLWSDGGAGGTFSPSATVLNATHTAPANTTQADLPITLSLTATCDGPDPVSATATTTLTVRPRYTLSLTRTGLGFVKVDGELHKLPWSGAYEAGAHVSLQAVPSTGWRVMGWSGAKEGAEAGLDVILDQDTALQASFLPLPGTLYSFPMDYPEEELRGWTGLASSPGSGWEWGAPKAGGGQPIGEGGAPVGADPSLTHGGEYLLGYVIGGNYTAGLPPQYLATPPLDFRGRSGVKLRFARWLEVEDSQFDTASIEVNAGSGWQPVWKNPATTPAYTSTFDQAWISQEYPLPQADGKANVQVRWVMGPTNSFAGTEYGGWSLDDIELLASTDGWSLGEGQALPEAVAWDQQVPLSLVLTNTGQTTWNATYALRSVSGATLPALVNTWGLDRIPVTGTVAPGASSTFTGTLTAPALSTLAYATPVTISAAGLASSVDCDWVLAQDSIGPLEGTTWRHPVSVSRFPDIAPGTEGAWARFYIEELAGRVPMIVQGYQDGTYGPTRAVTRDQIAVYIARALGLDQSHPTGTVFGDIPADYWAAGAIEACAAAELITGYPDHSYQPDLAIQREGMCKFIAKGRHYLDPSFTIAATATEMPFPDVPMESAFAPYVLACRNAGIVQGYTDGSFRPADGMTRDQLAVFVWRAFLRDSSATIVLGGPAFGVIAPTAKHPAVGQAASVTVGTPLYAWVLLDAVRTTGVGIGVSFELRHQVTADTYTLAGSFDASLSAEAVTAAHDAAMENGRPYLPAVGTIPTTGLQPGTYSLVTTVNGREVARRVVVEVKGP